MPFRRLWEAEAVKVGPPYERTLKVVLSPEVGGVDSLTFIISSLYPGSQTNVHHHGISGELMYFLSGRGKATLGDLSYDIEPDTALYAGPGIEHQIINTSDEMMKVACIYVPPLSKDYVDLAVQAARAEAEKHARSSCDQSG